MPYATAAELATALNIAVTTSNQKTLDDCLAAAASEIDHHLQAEGIAEANVPSGLLARVNLNRAVEWYKAPAMYAGVAGVQETGTMTKPREAFEPHAKDLLPFKQSWGLA